MTPRSSNTSSRRKTTSRRKNQKLSFKQLIIFLLIFIVVAIAYNWYLNTQENITSTDTSESVQPTESDKEVVSNKKTTQKKSRTSKSVQQLVVNQPCAVGNNQIVNHKYFTLSYNDNHEQADWVFYLLTKAMTKGNTERTNDFRADPDVKLVSAYTEDYTGTGYDRGHLCPSADVRLETEAQSETFYMSNMSPQAPAFNRGIWKKLEEQTRKWVGKHDSIYIATGPVLKNGLKKIGKTTKISVPEKYYKILYSPKDGGHMIAFVLPNNACSGKTYTDYIVSVDDVEQLTGIDFFSKISNEEVLESSKGTVGWWN